MRGAAFCPAHVTGFFKAEMGGGDAALCGSIGAGFSIERGITSTVEVDPSGHGSKITTSGFATDDTRVSEYVVGRFREISGSASRIIVHHKIDVPVGYGLGCSGAAALSLALALDEALGTGIGSREAGVIAHEAEVFCKTGLGDVLGSYHGGFEMRTRPGAPGTGRVEGIESGLVAVIACIAPMSTQKFLAERLEAINGLGATMLARLAETRDAGIFQDMSLQFARSIGVMTPRMDSITARLQDEGARCGVAMFGETVFALAAPGSEKRISAILNQYENEAVIESAISGAGARLLQCR